MRTEAAHRIGEGLQPLGERSVHIAGLDIGLVQRLGERRDPAQATDLPRKNWRRAVSRSQGSNTWLLPIPASFVVGTDGEVKSRFLDPDYRKRVAVEDLIAALKRAH